MLRRLYDWVLHWADTAYGAAALSVLAFAEASFFPVPPDVLLVALVIAVPRKWFRFAALCLVFSVIGGMFGYFIGWKVWLAVREFFFSYVFSEAAFDKVREAYARYDFWAVFIAGFTPIPYKVFTITAGVCRINFPTFVLASVLSRGARFGIVAGLLRIFGPPIKGLIDKYFNLFTLIFVILLVGGFLVLKIMCK